MMDTKTLEKGVQKPMSLDTLLEKEKNMIYYSYSPYQAIISI